MNSTPSSSPEENSNGQLEELKPNMWTEQVVTARTDELIALLKTMESQQLEAVNTDSSLSLKEHFIDLEFSQINEDTVAQLNDFFNKLRESFSIDEMNALSLHFSEKRGEIEIPIPSEYGGHPELETPQEFRQIMYSLEGLETYESETGYKNVSQETLSQWKQITEALISLRSAIYRLNATAELRQKQLSEIATTKKKEEEMAREKELEEMDNIKGDIEQQ